jgi:hypothetical protein
MSARIVDSLSALRPARWRRLGLAALALLFPLQAAAWTERATFGTRVHGHEFHRVTLESSECLLNYRLDFTAPVERYAGADAKAPRFRFIARIKLKSGAVVRSPVFPNAAAGERSYKGSLDTSGEGCWAKSAQKLSGFDVRGCRGQPCVPDEFD